MKSMRKLIATSLILGSTFLVAACGKATQEEASPAITTSGGRSGVIAVGSIIDGMKNNVEKRSAALLGIFVSEYLSIVPAAIAAESALMGVGAQIQIVMSQNTIQDPDFELLQAFADALQVDVADLLNRSVDRQVALDTYREALNNVAARSNDRFKELSSVLEELKVELRTLSNERSDAERSLREALREKDYSSAGEKQKAVNDAQAAYAEVDLKRNQIDDLVNTMEELLQLYGVKIVAIDANREVLISGAKVVDVPGIEDLEIIERVRSNSRRRSGGSFDSLFEGL